MGSTFLPLPGVMPIRSFPDIPFSQFSQIGSIDTGLALAGQGYGVCFARSFRIKGHEAYPHIHVLSFGKERVCLGLYRGLPQGLSAAGGSQVLVDSMKELRQDYKGNAPALHTESCGHFYGRNRILNDF
ncbi:MAG: hypothetical protein ACLR0U_23855 [Enterocloster clostridioformis]